MAEASSISAKLLTNVGELSTYLITCTASTTNTITIPSNVPVTTSSKVEILSVNNVSDGTTLGAITCSYSSASKRFTYTESGGSAEDLRIRFSVSDS